MSDKKLYDFAGFRLDEEQKCLWRDDDLVSLTPKAYETLRVLVQNQGKVISKNKLLDEVWANTFVEESTLAQNISTLRRTLGKFDKDREFIATIPRRGYRFIEDVTEIASDEEELVVEKHSITHIVAEQKEIHESGGDLESASNQTTRQKTSSPNRNFILVLSMAGFAAIAIGLAAFSYFSKPVTRYSSKFQKFQFTTLFSSADLIQSVVSPDGKYLAIVERKEGGDAIFLRQIEDGNMVEVLPKSNLIIAGISFSPASDRLFYTAYERGTGKAPVIGKLYELPILGGAPREILRDIDSRVAASGDGSKLAFIRNKLKEQKSVLIVSDREGSNEKEILAKRVGGFSGAGVSWSPDGKKLAVPIAREKEPSKVDIGVVEVETGKETILSDKSWLWIGSTKWLGDGSGIALVAYGAKSPNLTDEIWFVSYPKAERRVVTNGFKGVNGMSLPNGDSSIIATRANRITTAHVAPFDDLENSTEIAKTPNGEALLDLGIEWENDERIVFAKTQNGNADIWTMTSEGSKQRQITSDKSADFSPKVSPDGKYVFFLSNRVGAFDVWRIDRNGENPVQITKKGNVSSISLSPDGFIYFNAPAFPKLRGALWRTDLEGKNLEQITTQRTYGAKVSPDGSYIFCLYPDHNKDPQDLSVPPKFTVLRRKTGEIVNQFDSYNRRNLRRSEWSADSRSIYYIESDGKTDKLFQQKIDEEKPKRIHVWTGKRVYQFAVSKNGEKLFYEIGEEVNSVVKMRDEEAHE